MQVLKKYNNLIPLVLNALDMDSEDLIHKVFETFNEFVEIKKVLGPHLPQIIEKAIIISANTDFGVNLREVTILFLELIAERYARLLVKNHGLNFVDKVVEVGFGIASEDHSLYDENDASPPEMALHMLYAFACNVPHEKVYPIFQKYLQQFGTDKDEHKRAGATYILGYIADPEACLDFIKRDLNPLTNFLIDRMQDNSFIVREAAGEAVGRFSEHVVPDFLDLHKKVMPCLIKVVRDMYDSKHEMTIQKSLFALNEFVQNLDYDIKIYLDEVVTLLCKYAQQTNFGREVRYWALFALANTIGVSQKKIIPYQSQLLELFHHIITQGDSSESQNVKGQALMCVGKLASSCGKENFPTEAINVFTEFAMTCLKHNKDNKLELRETAITYFSDLSVLIKEEMQVIFEPVVTEILTTLKKEDEFKETVEKKEEAKHFSLDSDSEGDLVGLDFDVSQLDEKTAAVNALGIICCHSPKCAQPKMKEILETFETLQSYFHENVKFHVCLAYL